MQYMTVSLLALQHDSPSILSQTMSEDLRKDAAPASSPQPGSSASFTKRVAGTATELGLFPGLLDIALQNSACQGSCSSAELCCGKDMLGVSTWF